MDWLLNRAIAHRGLHDNKKIAENSLEAFAAAMNHDFPIELDVHLTSDGKIAVFHDDNLSRMTGLNKNIKDCTMEELKRLSLAGTECRIPALEETLNFVSNQVPLLIELKYDTPLGDLESKLLKALNRYSGRFAIQSFDPFRVRWFRAESPDICRGQLIVDFTEKSDLPLHKKLFLQSMQIVKLSDPQFLSVNQKSLTSKPIQKQKTNGRNIFAWTIRGPKELNAAMPYCDGVIFEGFIPPKPTLE